MINTPMATHVAAIAHKCTSCAEPISIGQPYRKWRTYDGTEAFTNKMHPECFEAHDSEGGTWEYMPFTYVRPDFGHASKPINMFGGIE